MNRVEKILSNARLTLADPNHDRWSDGALIAILNEAQTDFSQQTQMLHARVDVPILIGNPYFTLPDDCWMLTRVLHEEQALPLVTHQELDSVGLTTAGSGRDYYRQEWETTRGTPQAIIYDRRNMLEGKVYPIPDQPLDEINYLFKGSLTETFATMEVYGVVSYSPTMELYDLYGVTSALSDVTQTTSVEPELGVASAITAQNHSMSTPGFGELVELTDYTTSSPYGFTVAIEDETTADTLTSLFGVVTNVSEICDHLFCYYLKNPIPLEDVNGELDTPAMYDIALKFYVCGQAFMDDIDAAYQQKGAAQMAMYDRHLDTAKKDSMRDFTRAGQFQTTYRRGI